MPNDLFRNRVKNRINYAIAEADDAIKANHPGLEGRIREIAMSDIFKPLLSHDLDIGTGKIVDSVGNQSSQTDAVIYSKAILPPVMYSSCEGMFPIETCACAIEVKTRTSATQIDDAVKKAQKLKILKYEPCTLGGLLLFYMFFAFESDLTDQGKTEFERYKEYDPEWQKDPCIRAICVVGKGFWYFRENAGKYEWVFCPATQEHDEVINWLSLVLFTIKNVLDSRGRPHLGDYMIKQNIGNIVSSVTIQ